MKDWNLGIVSIQLLLRYRNWRLWLCFGAVFDHLKHTAELLSNPERRYLVHALGNELSLTVDARERAVPRHLLQRIRNISRRRGAAICRVGTWDISTDFYWFERTTEC